MVITGSMSDFVPYNYKGIPRFKDVNVGKLNKDDTYVAISGLNNTQQLEILEKSKDLNVLYKGPAAVNKRDGHGRLPRNTVIIFELV